LGLRYRKSINLGGGFRVNISKSGVGYSWGVKGYRITKTANGSTRKTYSIPGTGISYVEESGSGKKRTAAQKDPYAGYENIRHLDGINAGAMMSDTYKEFLDQCMLFTKARKPLIALAIISAAFSPVLSVLFAALLIFAIVKHPGKIEYTFDDESLQEWEELRRAWIGVATSQKLVQVTLTANAKSARRNAGMSKSVGFAPITIKTTLSKSIKTNIDPVVFCMKDFEMAILPDRILFFDKKSIGALPYDEVKIKITAVGYLESETVPTDAEIVEYRWAAQNKDGSPDRRVANNKQYPVMKYGNIEIYSTAATIKIMCSNEAASDKLNSVLFHPVHQAGGVREESEPPEISKKQNTEGVIPAVPEPKQIDLKRILAWLMLFLSLSFLIFAILS